jgi:hypothetical protein
MFIFKLLVSKNLGVSEMVWNIIEPGSKGGK